MKNIRFIGTYLNIAKWLFILATLLMIVESLSFLSIIGLQQRLIDEVLRAGEYEKTLEIVFLFILAFLLYAAMFTCGPYTIHKTTAKIQKYLSLDFMSYLYKMPTADLQKGRTATFVHYISQDVEKVSQMAGNQLPRGIQQFVSAVFLLFVVGMASPLMMFLIILCSVFYIFIGRIFSKRLNQAAKEVQETKSRLLVHLEEGISSTREVLAYHRLIWEEKLYRLFFKQYYDKVMNEGKVVNLTMISSEPLNWGVRLMILGYGGYLVLQGDLSLGMFVVIFQFGSQLVQNFQSLFDFAMQMSGVFASVDRLRVVMEGEKWSEGQSESNKPIQSIRFDRVTFSYEQHTNKVLDELSLELPVGKKIAFVGTSGGGKSTITQLLIKFFEPLSGDIIVNGIPLRNWKRSTWMKKVSIVFQEPYLFPDTIQSNLLLGYEGAKQKDIRRFCHAAQIDDYIMGLPDQYETVIGDRGITLSGGQRQRLAIARALIRDSEILILDEATSALDQTTERYTQEEIDQLRKGKTTIIVAHRLSTIKNADIIYVMDRGKVIEQGTHEELMENASVYKQLVYHQQ